MSVIPIDTARSVSTFCAARVAPERADAPAVLPRNPYLGVMEQTMKVKETQYKGYRFRSRLEARWAVFFDALGLQWEYEPEGYFFDDGSRYLPDFFIRINPRYTKYQNAGYFVEIKGTYPSEEEITKLKRLSEETKHNAYLFFGKCALDGRCISIDHSPTSEPKEVDLESTACLLTVICAGIVFDWWPSYFGAAVEAARSARFEHGQVGAPDQWNRR